jgi:uncharacterized protein with HEPN domain
MSERTDQEFLSDIREAIQRIHAYVADLDYEAFTTDTKTQDAVIRNLEILGEATKNLTEEFRAAHGQIPWRNMAAVRDRLIHHYFGVNIDVVWQIVRTELSKVSALLPSGENEENNGHGV